MCEKVEDSQSVPGRMEMEVQSLLVPRHWGRLWCVKSPQSSVVRKKCVEVFHAQAAMFPVSVLVLEFWMSTLYAQISVECLHI